MNFFVFSVLCGFLFLMHCVSNRHSAKLVETKEIDRSDCKCWRKKHNLPKCPTEYEEQGRCDNGNKFLCCRSQSSGRQSFNSTLTTFVKAKENDNLDCQCWRKIHNFPRQCLPKYVERGNCENGKFLCCKSKNSGHQSSRLSSTTEVETKEKKRLGCKCWRKTHKLPRNCPRNYKEEGRCDKGKILCCKTY